MNEVGKIRPLTRIQREKQDVILEAALDIFSLHGFRGATIDQIAEAAGMSKPNLLYYFPKKDEIHKRLIGQLLDMWLAPLREMDADGDPIPFWGRMRFTGNHLFDLTNDPDENQNLAGDPREQKCAEQLRAALQEIEAPKSQLQRLGLL